MARNSTKPVAVSEKRPEERRSGWDDWEVRECMWTLIEQKRTEQRAAAIKANAPLMKKIQAMAAKELEDKRAERTVLTQLAKG